MYDRWADPFNVTTEFITVHQAWGLLASVFHAHGTSAEGPKWSHAEGRIDLPSPQERSEGPFTAKFEAPGMDLTEARVTWEAGDQEPAFGPTYTFVPKANGPEWLEAEAQWPDGRRSFALKEFNLALAHVTWMDAGLPRGASPQSSGADTWQWIKPQPGKDSPKLAHRSSTGAGLHEHWFTGASTPLNAGSEGELLCGLSLTETIHPQKSW